MKEVNDSTENMQYPVESESSNIQTLFKKGILSYDKGNIEEAIEIFQDIINQQPDFSEAYINLGDAYYKSNKVNEAIGYWKKALSIDSNLITCYINIGNAFYSQNNINDALPHWHVAVTLAPDNTTALMNLGAAYEKLGDISNAFKYYEQYLNYGLKDKSKDYVQILKKVTESKRLAANYFNTGIKYHKINDYKKALYAYLQSVKAYPNYPKVHLNLGNICYKAEKHKHAAKYWFQVIKLDPEDGNTCCNLGVVYEKLQRYTDAYCMYSRFLDIIKKQSIATLNVKKRMVQIKKHLDKNPEKTKKHLDKAEDYYKNRKYYEALWEYENYAILKPDQLSAYEYKITELKNILDPLTRSVKEAFEAGNKYFREKEFELAIKAYRRCMRLEPKGYYTDIAYKKLLDCAKFMRKV